MKDAVIIDNAMPDNIVERWKDHYVNNVRLTLSRHEAEESDPAFLSTFFSLQDMYTVFDCESWLLPYAQQFNPNIKIKHLTRAHLNVNTEQDKMVGHIDINPDRFVDDSFYVSCLIFLNPKIDNYVIGNGLTVGENEIENVFNRLVIFDGRTWHKADTPIDNFVRLTGYFSFSNIKGLQTEAVLRTSSYKEKNVWYR